MIKTGQTIIVSDFVIQAVAGEALSARDAVYIDTADGKAYKCDADDTSKIGFVGFAVEAYSLGATANIVNDGIMGGFSGLTINAIYYISGTSGAITSTKPTNYKVVGKAISASVIKIANYLTKKVTVMTAVNTEFGNSSSRFDITNPSGTTFRYTWDTIGTDPGINSGTVPVGTILHIEGENFSAANNGNFTVTGSGSNYFEITNASGVAEVDKTIGAGLIFKAQTFSKIPSTQYADIELVSGGAGAARSSSNSSGPGTGGSGAYAKKRLYGTEIATTETVFVGPGGRGGQSGITDGIGGFSSFGTTYTISATGGRSASAVSNPYIGGTPNGGDINISGGDGNTRAQGSTGSGTNYAEASIGVESFLSGRAGPKVTGKDYGGGAGGALNSDGPRGGHGVVIITEYY